MSKHNCPDCRCEEDLAGDKPQSPLFRKQRRLYPTLAEEQRYRELKERYGP